MSTDNLQPIAVPAVTEQAVQNEVDRLIAATCQKHGVTRDQIKDEVIKGAYAAAREMLEGERQKQMNPYVGLYEKSQAEIATLRAQLGAVQERQTAAKDDRHPPTYEMVRDRVGRATWFQLSEGQKLQAMGIDPQTFDKAQARAMFGRNPDTALAVDFKKVNPFRYRQLKEGAMALGITGK